MGLKKGWFFTSDAPALLPSLRISSLMSSFRITDLHKLPTSVAATSFVGGSPTLKLEFVWRFLQISALLSGYSQTWHSCSCL